MEVSLSVKRPHLPTVFGGGSGRLIKQFSVSVMGALKRANHKAFECHYSYPITVKEVKNYNGINKAYDASTINVLEFLS